MERLNWNKIETKGLYDMIVVGSSAGGIESLTQILVSLPAKFSQTMVIVQHISHDSKRSLANHFAVISHVPVREVEDKEPIEVGVVYFAPTNYHLLISSDGVFNLNIDPPVSFSRPSIDVLFQSAAEVYQKRVMGIILTGTNHDGADGLKQIRKHGGLAIVQNPDDARYPIMPQTALEVADPQLVMTLDEIGFFLNRL
ncbi:MAG: chemotaxis protein CheB [Bdellovibrio sp.]|nr:chemotaxis protein CheB [Bdellovibrio sp.]